MIPNPEFAAIVESRLPKDKPVVVACQTGVRSLAACDQLARMGYSPLAWLKDGLEAAKPGELPTVPAGKDPRWVCGRGAAKRGEPPSLPVRAGASGWRWEDQWEAWSPL
jgi:hypothetical protein